LLNTIAPILKRLGQEQYVRVNGDTPLWLALSRTVDQMNKICGQYKWQVTDEGIETLYEYDCDEFIVAPLSWLVELNALNSGLRRWAEKTVALMQIEADVCFEFERALDFMDMTVEDYGDDDGWVEEERYKAIQLALAEYRYGEPAEYSKRIDKLAPDPDELLKVIGTFDVQEDWQQAVIDWCREGIRLATTGKLEDFINVDETEDYPEGIWPHEHICFMWSLEDAVYDETYELLNYTWQEYGTIPLTHHVLLKEDEGEIPEHPPQWPYELKAWMIKAHDLEEAITIAWREAQCKTPKSRSPRR
jgi:hypothetical protein